jgi:hypothetical protein
VASRRERPERFRAEPETASASGGHVPPDPSPTSPLADPIDAAFGSSPPVSTAPAEPDTSAEPAEDFDWDDDAGYGVARPAPRRRVAPARQRARRVKAARRVRRTLRHIDPLSVLKVSLVFYGCFLLLWLVIVALAYWVIEAAGVFDAIEGFQRGLAVTGDFNVSLGFIEKWAFFIGLGMALIGSLVNLFLAFLYNVVADIVGGIELTFVERDL